MAELDVTQKAEIYETLSSLSMAFVGIVEHIQTIQQTGILTPKFSRLYQAFAQELQGEMNSEILLTLHGIEDDDWMRFGRVRDKWEKYLKGSDPKQRKPKRHKPKPAGLTRKH
jgi:hypothetical protein